MPQIDHVAIHRRSIPLRRAFVTAQRRARDIDVVLVEVRDSDGRSGWGEAPTSWRVTGESVESVAAAVAGPLREALRGLASDDPGACSAALERAAVRNSSARMALECATHDLAAQLEGVTLSGYLGGTLREVRTDMTLSAVVTARDRDGLEDLAREHVGAGFTTLKVKVGAGDDDVGTLVGVRRALGPDVVLRVDANQGWSPQEAVRIIGELEDAAADLEMVEQPVHRDDIEGLAFVTSHVHTPVMADESVWNRREFRDIIASRAADMINIKLAKTGGIRDALALADEARRHEIDVIIGCMAESHVGIAAAAAVASVLDSRGAPTRAHDLDGGLWLIDTPVEGGVRYDGPRVVLSPAPGTGITGLRAAPRDGT